MAIQRINPDNMHKNPAFTQVATVDRGDKLVFVGGQNAVNAKGEVASDKIGEQAAQAFKNVITALEAAGATLDDVYKITIYMVQGQSLQDAYAGVMKLQTWKAPPTVSMIMVAGLANPKYLIEIEAAAAIG